MKYIIKDEYGQVMRVVGRKEEAMAICALRSGWSYKKVAEDKPKFEFEEALF